MQDIQAVVIMFSLRPVALHANMQLIVCSNGFMQFLA
jgi:hypothetical protein